MPRELILADYLKGGADPLWTDGMGRTNRENWHRLLADLAINRVPYCYIPSDFADVYRVLVSSADKMTQAQANAGEQGDIAIARFLLQSSVTFYGDGDGLSVLSFDSLEPLLHFAALKVVQPLSVKLKELTLRCTRPTTGIPAATNGHAHGIYVPPRTGNPSTPHRVTGEDISIIGFTCGTFVPAGPINSRNHLDMRFTGSRANLISNWMHGLTCWSDPEAEGTKSVYVEGLRITGYAKDAPAASHLLYAHDNVNLKAVNVELDDWPPGKFGIAHWGGNAGADGRVRPARCDLDLCYLGPGGQGVGIIGSSSGPTTVTRSIAESRIAFQSRRELNIYQCIIRPKPSVAGTIACVTAYSYPGATVNATDVQFDMSFVGDQMTVMFDLQNSVADWNLTNVRAYSDKRHGSCSLLSSASGNGAGAARVRMTNAHFKAYHASDLEHADPAKRSVGYFAALKQGHVVADRCSFSGDASHDRGAIRLDNASPANLIGLELVNTEIAADRGLVLYSDASSSGKVKGTLRAKDKQLSVAGGHQQLRFPAGELAPVAIALPASPIDATLVIGTDFAVIRVDGPAAPAGIVRIVKVLVNNRPADTAAYAGAPLELLGNLRWEFGPGIAPGPYGVDCAAGAKALARIRLDPTTLRWVDA